MFGGKAPPCENDRGGYEALITPLRKHTMDGKLYTRRPITESKLIELASLSRDDLVIQCAIRQKDDPAYVPSECLLYFIRESRGNRPDTYFEKLYKLLSERVLRYLPDGSSLNGKTISLTKSAIREKVFGHFVELLASDQNDYSDKLDYYEINFAHALKKLHLDAQKQAWQEENRSTAFHDEESGEPTAEVESAAGSFDSFNASEFSSDVYRFDLYEAIDTLPPLQKRIIVMLQQGFPIGPKDSNAITIAKTLNKDEKTIRTHRDKAYATLRAALRREN
jgi:hypothetical protein